MTLKEKVAKKRAGTYTEEETTTKEQSQGGSALRDKVASRIDLSQYSRSKVDAENSAKVQSVAPKTASKAKTQAEAKKSGTTSTAKTSTSKKTVADPMSLSGVGTSRFDAANAKRGVDAATAEEAAKTTPVSMRQGTKQESTAESRLSQRRFDATSFQSTKLRNEAIAAQERADDDVLDEKINLTLERLQTTPVKKETPAGQIDNPEYRALYDALTEYESQKAAADQEAEDAMNAYNAASGMDAKKIAGLRVAPYFSKGTSIADASELLDEYLTYQQAMQDGVAGAGDGWSTARAALIGAGLTEDNIDEVADIWQRASNSEAMALSNQSWAEATREHPILSNVMSVPLNITSGLGYLDLATQKIGNPDKAIDFNTGTMRAASAASTIRDTTTEDMNGLESFLYQTGMSMADSAAVAALSQIGMPGASVLLSGSAATSAAKEAKERGGTDAQALGYGLAAGIAEGLFETVSLEMLTENAIKRLGSQAATQAGIDRIKTLLKSAGLQALTEGSEEVFTTIANTISDAVIMGDRSEYNTAVAEYMAAGKSEAEAKQLAAKDWLTGILGDFLGGALSGGIMGGTGTAISSAVQNSWARELEQAQRGTLQQTQQNTQTQQASQTAQQETTQQTLERLAMESVQEQQQQAQMQQAAQQTQQQQQQAAQQTQQTGKNQAQERGEAETGLRDAAANQSVQSENAGVQNQTALEQFANQVVSEEREQREQAAQEQSTQETVAPMMAQAYNGANTETEVNTNGGEELYLRGSGERNDSQNPGGQISAVEEDAGRDQSGDVQTRPADDGAASLTYGEKISTRALGISNGSTTTAIRRVEGGETEATRAAVKLAEENGVELVLFGGGNLRVKNKNGAYIEARGMKSGNTIYVRADHARYTAEQLMRHELGHKWIEAGEVNVSAVKERLAERFTPEEIDHLSGMYIDAYSGTGLTADEVWEEVICDALGYMNIFQGFDDVAEAEAGVFLVESGRAARANREETRAKGSQEAASDTGPKFSIDEIVDEDGRSYGLGVHLDSTLLENLTDSERVQMVKERVKELGGQHFTAFDNAENAVDVSIAKPEERFKNHNGKKKSVNRDLTTKYISNETKQESAVLLDELITTAKYLTSEAARYSHDWLDDNGKNDWDYWTTYVQGKNGAIWETILNIANAADGRKILYDIGPIKKVGQSVKSDTSLLPTGQPVKSGTSTVDASLNQNGPKVKQDFSRELNIEGEKVYNQTVVLEESTIDAYLKNYAAKSSPNYAQAYITYMTPDEFLSLTASESGRQAVEAASRPMDVEELGEVTRHQPIQMRIDHASGDVEGHEGRHRATAMMWAGIKNIPVLLFDSSNKNSKRTIAKLTLKGQYFGDTWSDARVQVHDLMPLSYANRDTIVQRFANPPLEEQGGETLKYSQELDIDKLSKENARLRARVERLKGETKLTKEKTVRQADVDKLARQIVKDYSSTIDASEISGELKAVGDSIVQGGEHMTYEALMDKLKPIADKVVKNAQVLNDQQYQEYKELRDELRTANMTLSKANWNDLMGYESYNDFRKHYFGKIGLVKDGIPVEAKYQELSPKYPNYFPADLMNPGNQLVRMAKVLDSLAPVYENPHSVSFESAVNEVANVMLDTLISEDVRQTSPTFADRQEKRLQETRARYQREIARVRESRDETIKKLKEQQKTKTKAASERRKASAIRTKLMKHTAELSRKLLKPTDKKHIPEVLRSSVAGVLESINLESERAPKRSEQFAKLKEAYKEIAGETVVDPSLFGIDNEDGLIDQIVKMGDKPIADMTSEELNVLWQAVRAVEASIQNYNKTLTKGKFVATSEWAQQFKTATMTRKNKRGSRIAIDLEDPYTFFSHYGEPGKAVYRMLRNAQDDARVKLNRIIDDVQKVTDPKTVKNAQRERHTFSLSSGEKLTLTTGQIMGLYNLSQREQAQEHLLKGGVIQPEIKRSGKQAKIERGTNPVALTVEDLSSFFDVLSEEEKNIAKSLQVITTTTLSNWGNEASMAAYGYKKFTGADYWPIHSAGETLQSTTDKSSSNVRSIANIGLAKAVVPGANNAVDVYDVFDDFAQHAADMIDYATWLLPMEDANRLFNYRFRDEDGRTFDTIKGLLDEKGGKGAQQYWLKLMENIQNGIRSETDATSNVMNSMVGNVKAAAVGANLRVVAQQPTAILRAAVVLDPRNMAQGLVKGATKGNGWEKAKKYAAIAKIKDAGSFDQSNFRSISNELYDSGTWRDKLNDKTGALAGAADAVTWGKIWNACEWQTFRTNRNIGPGSAEFYRKTAELFTEVIDQTQVVDGILQRSQIMRSGNSITKQATSFMGEPIKSLNVLLRSYDQLRYENNVTKKKTAAKTFARAAAALTVTDLVNAAVQSVIDAMRDDDEDKKYWARWLTAFTGITGDEESTAELVKNILMGGNAIDNMNPLGRIPYISDVWSIIQGFSVDRMDMTAVTDFINAATTFATCIGGNGRYTREYATKQLLSTAGKIFGISALNVTRDAWGIARTAAVETDSIMVQYLMEKSIYNISSESNKGRFMDILYRALESGDSELYLKIAADLINDDANGITGKSVESAMQSRYKKAQKEDASYKLPDGMAEMVRIVPDFEDDEDEASFDVSNLSAGAYQAYMEQRSAEYEAAVAEATQSPYFESLDEKSQANVYGYIDKLTHSYALADASGGAFTITSKWIEKAAGAKDEGISTAQYALFRTAYSALESDKDENGNTIEGQAKSDKVRAWLDGQDFTAAQKEYLWGTVYSGNFSDMENFASQTYTDAVESGAASKVETELTRLDGAVEASAFPSAAGKTITVGKEKISLSDEEQAKYAQEKGSLSYQYVESLIGDGAYTKADDETKSKMVSMVYDYANAVAKTKVSDYELDGWYAKAEAAQDYGVSLTQYIQFKTAADTDDNGSITKGEATAAIKKLNISTSAKAKLWQSCNAKWKDNPFE